MAKIPELKSEYIWLVALILFLIPAVYPLHVPFAMSPVTEEIYNLIESLPEGSIVIMGGGGVFAFDIESSAGQIPCIQQMARKGLRLVTFPMYVWGESAQFEQWLVDMAKVDKKYGGPWTYGEDYVYFPMQPTYGLLVDFLTDVHKTLTVDVYGTPIDELPLMNDLHSYEDIAVWMCPHWAFPDIISVATAQFNITSISFAQSAAYAFFSPFMMAYPGKVFMTNGYVGGAQYEKLCGMTGLGHKVIDSYALISVLTPVLFVLGNITMLTRMREEKEEEVEVKKE